MIIFSCFIFLYFAYLGRKYIPEYARRLTAHLKYGVLNNWKETYNNYVNRFELSEKGLKNIKDAFLKTNKNEWFNVSESLLLCDNDYFNASTLSDLLSCYKNVLEWGSTELGDVLYILNVTPLKTTRAYMRNIRCFHILLDEFIYYLYKNLNEEHIKNKFGNNHIYLKIIICYYGLSEGESRYLTKNELNYVLSESSENDSE